MKTVSRLVGGSDTGATGIKESAEWRGEKKGTKEQDRANFEGNATTLIRFSSSSV